MEKNKKEIEKEILRVHERIDKNELDLEKIKKKIKIIPLILFLFLTIPLCFSLEVFSVPVNITINSTHIILMFEENLNKTYLLNGSNQTENFSHVIYRNTSTDNYYSNITQQINFLNSTCNTNYNSLVDKYNSLLSKSSNCTNIFNNGSLSYHNYTYNYSYYNNYTSENYSFADCVKDKNADWWEEYFNCDTEKRSLNKSYLDCQLSLKDYEGSETSLEKLKNCERLLGTYASTGNTNCGADLSTCLTEKEDLKKNSPVGMIIVFCFFTALIVGGIMYWNMKGKKGKRGVMSTEDTEGSITYDDQIIGV